MSGRDDKVVAELLTKKHVFFVDPDKSDRSLLADLILTSEKSMKLTFCEIYNILVSYKNIKSNFNWSDISFEYNRNVIARIMLSGQTFSLYLAKSPDEYLGTRIRVRDVSSIKKYAKTPSLLRIKVGGDTTTAGEVVEDMMAELGAEYIGKSTETLTVADLAYDTPENLFKRGLIKPIEKKDPQKHIEEAKKEDADLFSPAFTQLYGETLGSIDGMVDSSPYYNEVLKVMREGDATARLSKRFVLKAIDEIWVRTIEDTLPALDDLIRAPSHYIEESEKILPIEMTKQISPRSIKHLCMHTDYISRVEGDSVIPSKLLNVFRDDSVMTYENKFINTLINRLYLFVSRRYEIAAANAADEQTTRLEFSQSFLHGDMTGRINFSVELSKPIESAEDTEGVKNYTYTTDLWDRVKRLYGITRAYTNSDFARTMERNYIRPPIMRTNPILKNKNLRQCLALWEFIESYEASGYEMLIQESVEDISQDYLKELYSTLAIQYFIFRHNIKNEFNPDKTLGEVSTNTPVAPKIIGEIDGVALEDFDFGDKNKKVVELQQKATDDDILFAVEVALRAAEKLSDTEAV